MLQVLDTNLSGTLLGCQMATPWLIESATAPLPRVVGQPLPGILNIASVFGVVSPPGFAAYNASKAGVIALSETIRGELAPHGLNVTVALPGATPTGLFADAAFASAEFGDQTTRYMAGAELSPEQVAEQALAAAAKGQTHAVIGKRARRFAWLKRMAPSFVLNQVAKRARQQLGLPTPPDQPQD